MHRQTQRPDRVWAGDKDILKDVELNVSLRLTELRNFDNHPQNNAMTGVHGYDIRSIPIVFHYSVGLDIAYPRMVGIAKASVNGIGKRLFDPRFFVCHEKENVMRYEATSTETALAANGRIINAATPWHIIVDTDEETITVRKRNLSMIGVDEDVLAFRFIRRIRIDEHLFGADIEIKAVGGAATAYCLSKKDCKKIKQILMEYNATKRGKGIIFS